MGKESLERRLGKLEEKVEELEGGLLELRRKVAEFGSSVQVLKDHANDVPVALRTAVDELTGNQRKLEYNFNLMMHVIDPEHYPDPNAEKTDAVSEEEDRGDQAGGDGSSGESAVGDGPDSGQYEDQRLEPSMGAEVQGVPSSEG